MPRMNAYRAIYPGPQRQANSSAPGRSRLGAMSYAELGRGTLQEHEAVQSTVLNRIASGHGYWVKRGEELNEENVINAPGQYQGVREHPDAVTDYLDGTAVGAQNAATAERNLRRTGKPITDATSYIAHLDGSPPSDEEIFRLGHVVYAGKVGRVYLYRDSAPPVKR